MSGLAKYWVFGWAVKYCELLGVAVKRSSEAAMQTYLYDHLYMEFLRLNIFKA